MDECKPLADGGTVDRVPAWIKYATTEPGGACQMLTLDPKP